MANKQKKNTINIDSYKRLQKEHLFLDELLKEVQGKFEFPVDSVLEIGTGIGTHMTRFLVENERSKNINKFYAMEPVDEFFEQSKRHVVRLSRTDAISQEYYGGNPFDVITFSLVYNHIKPDEKAAFIENISNNFREGGKLVLFDVFIQDYDDNEQKKENEKALVSEQREYFRGKNQYMMNYFTNVMNDIHDDFWVGSHKASLKDIVKSLEFEDFVNIKTQLYTGEGDADWEKMGYYIITADKED